MGNRTKECMIEKIWNKDTTNYHYEVKVFGNSPNCVGVPSLHYNATPGQCKNISFRSPWSTKIVNVFAR
eukprot:Pgem_evm1s17972